ncbi:Helix-turn-helix [Mesorhizobium albiziae]|uniref:Helix-turn-helix n=1 Tax=Neomesorhizobium albiziae TaxID=335020 RepID=A0A1I4A5P1_9HYPH|nr:helix-turn-helix transcriptional regulator [Mesorhizobium albiziae]GLS34055.1 hypothetical protein GCM10007937_57680 [Mesorhizobium albiziae]SFK51644.1 Helix-turn-helix [Mesorhizobium albiziae]
MTLNVDKQWFVDRLAEKGLSLREVAKKLDMDPGALSRTLSGKRRMQLPEVDKIATVLNVPPEIVLAHSKGMDSVASNKNSKPEAIQTSERSKVGRHPGFGFMKGLITFEKGFDVTKPFSDEPWDRGYLGEGDRK